MPEPRVLVVSPYDKSAIKAIEKAIQQSDLGINPSNDGGYNRRLRDMLLEIRFRPAVRMNGRPVQDTAVVTAEAPRS